MRSARQSATANGERQYQTRLATAEAERDRYQLLLDINNAVVNCLGFGKPPARDL
jgi:hypothetical protein